MASHAEPTKSKKKGKRILKRIIVNKPVHIHQRIDALMALNAQIYVNPKINRKNDPNNS